VKELKYTDSISKANLSNRTYSQLHEINIHTIGDLVKLNPEKLVKQRSLTKIVLQEVLDFLDKYKNGGINIKKPRFKIEETMALEYFDSHEELADISISELGLSAPAYSRLKSHGCKNVAELFDIMYSGQLRTVEKLGLRSESDIIRKTADLYDSFVNRPAFLVADENNPCKVYVEQISTYIPVNPFNLFSEIASYFDERNKDSLFIPMVREALKSQIMDIIDDNFAIPFTDIFAYFPAELFPQEIVEQAIIELESLSLIFQSDEGYQRKRIEIQKFLTGDASSGYLMFPESHVRFPHRYSQFLHLFLNGNSIIEIGEKLRLTSSRVSQVMNKATLLLSKRVVPFHEDRYSEIFEAYRFSLKNFTYIFQESEYVYRYLALTTPKKRQVPLETFIEDEKISENLKERARFLLLEKSRENKIEVLPGEYVEKTSSGVLEHILLTYFREDRHQTELYSLYLQFLKRFNLESEKRFLTTERSLSQKLAYSNLVLNKQKMMIRYFDFDNFDFDTFWSELNLIKYPTGQYSTKAIFLKHPKLMKKYDIRDGNELHNLMKKVLSKKDTSIIQFKRMPHIQLINEQS